MDYTFVQFVLMLRKKHTNTITEVVRMEKRKHEVILVKHYLCGDCGKDYDMEIEAEECNCGYFDREHDET